MCNISSDWAGVVSGGLLPRRDQTTPEGRQAIDAVIAYADRYWEGDLKKKLCLTRVAPCEGAGIETIFCCQENQ